MKIRVALEAEYNIPDHFYDADIVEEESSIISELRARVTDTGGFNFSYSVKELDKSDNKQ